MNRSTIVASIAIVLAACAPSYVPERPDNVPTSAVWAGGPDGGAWIDCDPAAKEPHLQSSCNIHGDRGEPWASGHYIVAERRGDVFEYPGGGFLPPKLAHYEFYNGDRIVVSHDRHLVPSGWIDYPFGEGHGKRVRYVGGKAVEEVEY